MPPIPVIEYLAVILVGFAAWLLGRLRPDLISPFGDLIARIMHNRNTRIAVIVVWWWLGWHFFTV
ncbi:MAG: hypothetical protein RL096_104 [Actinomycetota bacterium]|jgi:hypothetical protein